MKQTYGIPVSLDASYADMQIRIKDDKSGIGIKPMSMRDLLFVVGGVAGGFLILSETFVSQGSFGQKAIFVILWIMLCGLLLMPTKTKQNGLLKLPSVMIYYNPGNRHVLVRKGAPAGNMVRICGFTDMDPETGVIHYADGTCGMLFDAVGNASVLLFDSHKEAIIDRVDAHYRKMRPETTYHFITRKQPQEVTEQVASLDKREMALRNPDPDLIAMAETERYVLKKAVGESCKSLHQYLLLQANNEEELRLGYQVLASEIENSSLMVKRLILLGPEDSVKLFSGIYSGKGGD